MRLPATQLLCTQWLRDFPNRPNNPPLKVFAVHFTRPTRSHRASNYQCGCYIGENQEQVLRVGLQVKPL